MHNPYKNYTLYIEGLGAGQFQKLRLQFFQSVIDVNAVEFLTLFCVGAWRCLRHPHRFQSTPSPGDRLCRPCSVQWQNPAKPFLKMTSLTTWRGWLPSSSFLAHAPQGHKVSTVPVTSAAGRNLVPSKEGLNPTLRLQPSVEPRCKKQPPVTPLHRKTL